MASSPIPKPGAERDLLLGSVPDPTRCADASVSSATASSDAIGQIAESPAAPPASCASSTADSVSPIAPMAGQSVSPSTTLEDRLSLPATPPVSSGTPITRLPGNGNGSSNLVTVNANHVGPAASASNTIRINSSPSPAAAVVPPATAATIMPGFSENSLGGTTAKRVTLVAAASSPAAAAVQSSVISNKSVLAPPHSNITLTLNHQTQQQLHPATTQPNNALPPSVSLTTALLQPSTPSTLAGAVPASGYLNQVTPSSQPAIAINPVSVLQGNGSVPRPVLGLPNGSATSASSTIRANPLAPNSTSVTLSAISHPQYVITSSASQNLASTPNAVNANRTAQISLNSTPNMGKQHFLIATSKDGGQTAMLVQTTSTASLGASSVITSLNQNMANHVSQPAGTTTTTVFTVGRPAQSTVGGGAHQAPILVSNPNMMGSTQVLLNMPSRPGAPGAQLVQNQTLQRALAPRSMVLSQAQSPIRIAPSGIPGGRPGTPLQLPQNITFSPNLRGAILVKTDNGQYQLVNVGPNIQQGTNANLPANFRFQVPVSAGNTNIGQVRTMAPQQTVTLPASLAQTVIHQAASRQVTQPLTIQTTVANNNAAATPSQMSPNTAKKKCKNFLSTLIRLASDQPEQVATNVRNLIQGLIDGQIQPEDFTNQLQQELNSSPQPCLVPFLKKSLPYLRHSLMIQEMTIEGVKAPPKGSVQLPQLQQAIPQIQIAQGGPRPGTAGAVRFMTTPHPPMMAQLPGTVMTRPGHPNSGLGAAAIPPISSLPAPSSVASTTPVPAKASAKSKSSSKGRSPAAASKAEKEKKSTFASLRDDDDINDVAAMGGVNLVEESQRMATSTEFVGTQIRSCKDENFLFTQTLHTRINQISKLQSLDDAASDVVSMVSHAAQEYLKNLVEKLGVIAEHRLENIKSDARYETTQDIRGQIKFLEELDRLEKKRHEEQEREMLLRAAKSRSKLEDPEQLKLKQKAKEMQRAEQEEVRQREANETALLAIGPRKKMKLSSQESPSASATVSGTSAQGNFSSNLFGSSSSKLPMRRLKRVNMRDLQFLMEQEKETVRSSTLYKAYAK